MPYESKGSIPTPSQSITEKIYRIVDQQKSIEVSIEAIKRKLFAEEEVKNGCEEESFGVNKMLSDIISKNELISMELDRIASSL
jgi:hypothetical protein